MMKIPTKISIRSIAGGIMLLALLTLASCEINPSDNGYLDNWWYLRTVERLDAEGNAAAEDYVANKVLWGYIGNLMQTEGGGTYSYTDEAGKRQSAAASKIFFRFEQQGSTLRIYEPRYNAKGKGDPLLDPAVAKDKACIDQMLTQQGINLRQQPDGTLEETFTVEHLDDECMVLLNEDKTLRLRFAAW